MPERGTEGQDGSPQTDRTEDRMEDRTKDIGQAWDEGLGAANRTMTSWSLSASQPPALRRTRFVCISDTHNYTFKLPRGDVLIHAGDLTNQGTYSELSRTVQWLEKADFEVKLVVAGNHDVMLDVDFYREHGAHFHNKIPESLEKCLSLLTSSPSITYLCHGSTTVHLSRPDGPRTTFKVFGSPYSPRLGNWAFGYDRRRPSEPGLSGFDQDHIDIDGQSSEISMPAATAQAIWSAIPLDSDVVITHTPPHLHCDESISQRRALGCEELRQALWRVRPRLAICGHVHEARGAERIQWDIAGEPGSANVTYHEVGTETWEDPGAGPGNGKLSLVDLTGRGGRRPLQNDGSHPPEEEEKDGHDKWGSGELDELVDGACASHHDHYHRDASSGTWQGGDVGPGFGTRGMGGDPAASVRCDREALRGRMGRRETCVVNAAVTANSYPHVGGKRFNKPIVIDVDLPVWSSS